LDADIIGLNEVTPSCLSRLLKHPSIRDKYPFVSDIVDSSNPKQTVNHTIDRRMGNIIFSKVPMKLYALSFPKAQSWWLEREVVIGLFKYDEKNSLAVCSAHLTAYESMEEARNTQLNQVMKSLSTESAFNNVGNNFIIMGDLNIHQNHENNMFADLGLVDLWAETHFSSAKGFDDRDPGYTFDYTTNKMIRWYIPIEKRKMRLDRMLVKEGCNLLRIHSPVKIFANKAVEPGDHIFLSDHYGLCASFDTGVNSQGIRSTTTVSEWNGKHQMEYMTAVESMLASTAHFFRLIWCVIILWRLHRYH